MACSTDQQNKTEQQMEPRILAIGRLQSTLDVLVEEWERYGRNVIASNSKELKIAAVLSLFMLAFGQDLGSKLSVRVTYVVKSYFAVVIHQDIRVAGWVKDQLLCMANLVITQDSSFVAVSSLFHARVRVTVRSSSYESFTLSHHLLLLLLLLLLLGLVVGWVNDQ